MLHLRSHYSIGAGVAPVRALVDRAHELGHEAVLLADVETLAGQPELHARAAERGMRALSGLELRERPGRGARLLLVATDRAGYGTLCGIVSRRRGARPPLGLPGPAVLSEVPEGAPGLLLLTDDPRVAKALLARRDLERGSLGFLLRRPATRARSRPSAALVALARQTGVPLVADVVAALPSAAHRPLGRLAAALAGGDADEGASRLGVVPPARHLEALFRDAPEALRNGRELTEGCTLRLEAGRPILPALDTPGGASPDAHLRELVEGALSDARSRGRCTGAAYDRRAEHELRVFAGAGLSPYVLLVREVATEAQRLGLPVALRGSGAASLLAHLLGFSPVNPVARDLLFERFLDPRRQSLPDFDLDVCAEGRDRLLEALFRRFGADRVAQLSSYQTLGRVSAVARGLAATGASEETVARVRSRLPPRDLLADMEECDWRAALDRALARTPFRAAGPVLADAVGLPTHLSVHPGALVVGDRPLDRIAPLELAPKGVPVLQYGMEAAAWLGFVKLDILGNRALSQIRRAEELAGAAAAPVDVADGDPATLEVIRSGRTMGCFQLETPPVRNVLARLRVSGRDDVMAALALVRPGPGSARDREAYLSGSPGEDRPLLYEDDVIRLIAESTGLSLGDADRVRERLVAAGGEPAAIEALGRRFVARAAERGVERGVARKRWTRASRFAAYAFNRAHAASFAEIAWRCAALRAHAPVAFACAVLDHYGGGYPLRSVAAAFAREGIPVRPPHVGRSEVESVPEDGAVRLGLRHLKGLASATASSLVEARLARPFRDAEDFVARVAPAPPELRALVLSGAMDGLAPLEPARYPAAHEALLRSPPAPQLRLGVGGGEGPPTSSDEPERRLARVRNELRFLEMHPSAHPLSLLRGDPRLRGVDTAVELRERSGGETVRFAGIVAASRRSWTIGDGGRAGGGSAVHFLTLEDETGLVEAVVGPEAEARLRERITTPGPYLMYGRRSSDPALTRIEVAELLPLRGVRREASAVPS